jgi:MYXO-CTERM domain-containing protein
LIHYTSTDTVGILHTDVQTWSTGAQYDVKLNASKSAVDSSGTGKSGTPGTGNDELVLTSVSSSSTGLTVDSVLVSMQPFSAGQYSFVIADVTANLTTFDNLLADGSIDVGTSPGGLTSSLGEMPDGSGGQDLLLDVSATPEPGSPSLLGATLISLALGRRRRRRSGAMSAERYPEVLAMDGKFAACDRHVLLSIFQML